MAEGKPENKFAFNGRAKTKNFAMNVLRETHQQWCSMMASKREQNFCRTHTTELKVSKKSIIGQEAARAIVEQHPEAGPDEEVTAEKVHLWHHNSAI